MRAFHLLGFSMCVGLLLTAAACAKRSDAAPRAGADIGPAPTTVVEDMDSSSFKVEHPERFPLATATEHGAVSDLNVTGAVSPDVSRQVPAPSLASGKVLEIDARLGDSVKKGQLLFKVQSSDIAGAYSDYRKAVMNEQLALKNQELTKVQRDRAQVLFDHGAVPKSAVEIAVNNETASQTALMSTRVDLETSTEHLKLYGSDPEHPSGVVSVYAPVDGVITDQQITIGAAVQALTPPNPFTISDVSHVWIICDVFENNMAQIRTGQIADVRFAAYPDRIFHARINNILPTIDPNIRTAKVRLEVENTGVLRLGMFAMATLHGDSSEKRAVVPVTAILHLHDRDWVYSPMGSGQFRRLEVTAGNTLANNLQEIVSGIKPGDQVITKALVFQNTVEQ